MKRKRSQVSSTEEPKNDKRSPKKRVLLKRNTIIAVRNDSNEFWLARLKQDCVENMNDVSMLIERPYYQLHHSIMQQLYAFIENYNLIERKQFDVKIECNNWIQ